MMRLPDGSLKPLPAYDTVPGSSAIANGSTTATPTATTTTPDDIIERDVIRFRKFGAKRKKLTRKVGGRDRKGEGG